MDFILANKAMEKGKRVRRRCWNEGVYTMSWRSTKNII